MFSCLVQFQVAACCLKVLQQLPGKTESTMRVPMAFEQQELYDELRTQFVRDVSANKDASIKGQSGSSMMMQLRKAANHQLLHRRHFGDDRLRQMAKLMLQVYLSRVDLLVQ